MKTILLPYRKLSLVAILAAGFSFTSLAQTVSLLTDGMKFQNPNHIAGSNNQVGAVYLFQNVAPGVDATVSVDSLVGGAQLTNIDDNSNGVGYRDAFQPAIRSGNTIGTSYAVFTFRFYEAGTNNTVMLDQVDATALDLDGNLNLKELVEFRMGTGATATYMSSYSDLSILQILAGQFLGMNMMGIERSGIDTASMANMFTAHNSGISSFSLRYGMSTLIPTNTVRQFSLYMKGFTYPDQATLPLELLSFTTTLKNKTVDLNWVTLWEKNLSHFEVERSMDGKTFQQIGLVFGVGNSDYKSTYSIKNNVNEVNNGIIYYRLKLVDQDGSYGYSDIRAIRIGSKSEVLSVMTYPNPVVNELKITIPNNWQGRAVSYELYNANGRLVKTIRTQSASQTEMINMNDLGRGFYVLKASQGTEVAQQKIIKQ